MKVAVFSTKPYDQRFLIAANAHTGHDFLFLDDRLNERSAALASDCNDVGRPSGNEVKPEKVRK